MIKNYANKVMDYEYNAFMTLMNVSVSKHLFDEHFGVEDIGLVDVDVYRIVFFQGLLVNVILDRCNLVVNKQFLPVYLPGKTAHAVIHGDDVRIEAPDQHIEGL